MWNLITTLLPLILKNLPLIVGIFSGLSKSAKKMPIDEEALAQLVEELTVETISKVVKEQQSKLRKYASSETTLEMRESSDRVNKLLDEMEQDLLKTSSEREALEEELASQRQKDLEKRMKEWEERAKERDALLEQIRASSSKNVTLVDESD